MQSRYHCATLIVVVLSGAHPTRPRGVAAHRAMNMSTNHHPTTPPGGPAAGALARDFVIVPHGDLRLVRPCSQTAYIWLRANSDTDRTWYEGALVIDASSISTL